MKNIKTAVKKYRKDVLVKFVKKANMWCKTYWDDDSIQKQEWSVTEPDSSRPETK